jgi:hypothetical protein
MRSKKKKHFFFVKKKQKAFTHKFSLGVKSFLVLFFKKEHASFLDPAR